MPTSATPRSSCNMDAVGSAHGVDIVSPVAHTSPSLRDMGITDAGTSSFGMSPPSPVQCPLPPQSTDSPLQPDLPSLRSEQQLTDPGLVLCDPAGSLLPSSSTVVLPEVAASNQHSMITRSKAGIFKPKLFQIGK
ncbi:hypothetical protein V6N13_029449 [Hibiscus sabdariffa]